MSFREKVRKAVGRGSSSATSSSPISSAAPSQEISRVQTPLRYDSGSNTPIDRENLTIDPREVVLTQVTSNATIKKRSTMSKIRSSFKKEDPYKDWPEHIYKPHEMPRAKYRRPVDPDHQQTLQSYSLRTAFADMRRRSGVSQYSPMGSRLPSRRGSFSSRLRSAGPSRNHSVVGVLSENEASNADISNDGRNLPSSHIINTLSPIPVRPRGNTITSNSTVPDLIQSSSIDSDDTESFMNTSQAVTLGNVSQPGGVLDIINFSKPFDGEELTRALTRKLALVDDNWYQSLYLLSQPQQQSIFIWILTTYFLLYIIIVAWIGVDSFVSDRAQWHGGQLISI